MATGDKSVRLAGSVFDCRSHVCAFFQSREDEYEVALPFLKEGLEAGDRAVQIISKQQRTERLRRYDVHKFSSSIIMDILRTHPMAIIGGILRENPFYVPPHEFLQELSSRGSPVH